MAQLPLDVVDYLRGNLRTSIENDFKPILDSGKGGYFAIPRLVFCTVEYLGNLYCGYSEDHWKLRKRFNQQVKLYEPPGDSNAKAFLRDVLGQIDQGYRDQSETIYDMFRHGTVHQYSPKKYRAPKQGTTLGWLSYPGGRKDQDVEITRDSTTIKLNVSHIQIYRFNNDDYLLPVSINCLYEDLVESVDKLADILSKDSHKKKSAQDVYEIYELEPTDIRKAWWV